MKIYHAALAVILLCASGCNSYQTALAPKSVCASKETARNLAGLIFTQLLNQETEQEIANNSDFSLNDVLLNHSDSSNGKVTCSAIFTATFNDAFVEKYHIDGNSISTQRVGYSVQPTADGQMHYEIQNPEDCCRALLMTMQSHVMAQIFGTMDMNDEKPQQSEVNLTSVETSQKQPEDVQSADESSNQ